MRETSLKAAQSDAAEPASQGMSFMSDPIRIIAWGNIGRRDDGAALVLADRLATRYDGVEDVLIQEYHQLGPELVDDLRHCRLAIFIDAHTKPDAGDVICERIAPARVGGMDTHHCPPEVLLGLTAAMNLRVPEAWLIGIRGHDWEFGDTLSEPARRAMLEAERQAIRLVEQTRRPSENGSPPAR